MAKRKNHGAPDPVDLINNTEGPFWICGLAREIWPSLIGRLDELGEFQRIAVEHYASKHQEATNRG